MTDTRACLQESKRMRRLARVRKQQVEQVGRGDAQPAAHRPQAAHHHAYAAALAHLPSNHSR